MTEHMTTVIVPQLGGPEVYTARRAELPCPGQGQVLVKLKVSGVNFLDVAQRKGATPVKAPFAAGVEGVGVVTALGEGVSGFESGQRVGWLAGGQGSFSEYAVVDATKLVSVPDYIDDETAVAVLMQGVTAHYLTTDTFPVAEGDVVLVHAAAGGVGQLLTQVASFKGATVIGTTSTQEKAEIARKNGAGHVFGYRDFAERVREVTGGVGASVVYDGVGKDTFSGDLEAVRVRGTVVVIGNASGPIPAVEVNALNTGGSLYLTRPTVMHHIRTAEELNRRVTDVFAWVASGKVTISIGARYPIADISEAFRALESRSTTGKVVLLH